MRQQRWASVATAPDQAIAEMWAEMLRSAGLDGAVSPEDAVSFLGVSPRPCRVIVPESQVAAARNVLAEFEDNSSTERE
jgi:hypothetical protein